MRVRASVCALAVVVFCCQVLLSGEKEARSSGEAAQALASMGWLAGMWSGPHEGGTWEASYTSAEGGEILSANKEIKGDRVVMIEFERFSVQEDRVVMTPYPFGRKSEASFGLVEYDRAARRAVFTNPEHDFPNRIVYHRVSDGRLVITVAGQRRGQDVEMTLDLARR